MTSALNGGEWSTSRPGRLYPRERPATHCTGAWVGSRAGLDGCGKSRPHRDSIPDLATTEASVFFFIIYTLLSSILTLSAWCPSNMNKKINILFLITVLLEAHSSSWRLTRKLRTTIYPSDFCRYILSIFYYTKVVFSPPQVLTFLCPLW